MNTPGISYVRKNYTNRNVFIIHIQSITTQPEANMRCCHFHKHYIARVLLSSPLPLHVWLRVLHAFAYVYMNTYSRNMCTETRAYHVQSNAIPPKLHLIPSARRRTPHFATLWQMIALNLKQIFSQFVALHQCDINERRNDDDAEDAMRERSRMPAPKTTCMHDTDADKNSYMHVAFTYVHRIFLCIGRANVGRAPHQSDSCWASGVNTSQPASRRSAWTQKWV